MSFDINVLVNGSRCKQYGHQGKTYIEAKDGSEWYFQIQNNSPSRILAVCSVDGLNVLTGESASPKDSGYIIDAYSSQKIKGFRFSDEEWALFKFGYKVKGKTYAQSKGDGAEKNCGIIGICLFKEKQISKIQIPYLEPNPYYPPLPSIPCPTWKPHDPWKYPTYEQSSSYSMYSGGTTTSTVQNNLDWMEKSCDNQIINTSNLSTQYMSSAPMSRSAPKVTKKVSFDMGTEFGRRENSKIETVSFEKGNEVYSTDIYYASRNSLKDMGIPISSTLKASFPQSFPNKYAKPPEGWTGA